MLTSLDSGTIGRNTATHGKVVLISLREEWLDFTRLMMIIRCFNKACHNRRKGAQDLLLVLAATQNMIVHSIIHYPSPIHVSPQGSQSGSFAIRTSKIAYISVAFRINSPRKSGSHRRPNRSGCHISRSFLSQFLLYDPEARRNFSTSCEQAMRPLSAFRALQAISWQVQLLEGRCGKMVRTLFCSTSLSIRLRQSRYLAINSSFSRCSCR